MSLVTIRALLPLPCLVLAVLVAAPPVPRSADAPSGRDLYRTTLGSMAWVHAAGQGKGTGWIVDVPRRLLITNYHVVGENDGVEVIFPFREEGKVVGARAYYLEHMPRLRQEGFVVRGKVLRREPDIDLALVELESLPSGIVSLHVAVQSAQPGDAVQAIGNRYDSPVLWVYVAGTVRQRRRLAEGYFNGGKQLAKGVHVLDATLPVNEGDSGGPLLDKNGAVVGVTAAWDRVGSGLFIDVEEVRVFLNRAGFHPVTEQRAISAPGRDVYRRLLSSFALVRQPDNPKRGSGFVVNQAHRLLITEASLVGPRTTVDITFPIVGGGKVVGDTMFYASHAADLRRQGRIVTGVVLAKDERRNLALVEVPILPDDVTAVTLAAEPAEPGDSAHSLGNPERSETLWAYSAAWVRQVGRTTLGRAEDPDAEVVLLQTAFAEGEAGGPVVNDNSQLIGVVSGKGAPQQLLSYALAASEVGSFL